MLIKMHHKNQILNKSSNSYTNLVTSLKVGFAFEFPTPLLPFINVEKKNSGALFMIISILWKSLPLQGKMFVSIA
jgi:hypothetical protein